AGDLHHQVDSLLCCQPRYVRDDRPIHLYRQRKRFEQVAFARLLSRHIVDAEVRRKLGIGRGIPDLVIDTVRYADQTARSLTRELIELVTVLSGLYFHFISDGLVLAA